MIMTREEPDADIFSLTGRVLQVREETPILDYYLIGVHLNFQASNVLPVTNLSNAMNSN